MQNIPQNVAQKETIISQNFEAIDQASFCSFNPLTTGGLVFGYIGGLTVNAAGAEQTLADGTITLTATATNYIEYNPATNTVTSNTTGFTTGRLAMYKVSTSASTMVNPIEKHKPQVWQLYNTPIGGGGGSTTLGTATPQALGTAAPGTSTNASREDHIHPLPLGLVPTGGTAGQVLSKVDGSDYSVQWVAPATGGSTYTLPVATTTVLGGVKIGTGLAIDVNGVLSTTASGGGGLTNFTDSSNSTTPNTTVNYSVLTAIGTTTNIDIAIQPKGTGAFSVGPPADSTVTGGNKRGPNAVDLQRTRATATQVASGGSSFAAGLENIASGFNSVAIGKGNTASGGNNVCVAVGTNNTNSGNGAVIVGFNNVLNGDYTFTAGLSNNVNSSANNSIVVGESNTVQSSSNYVMGKSNNVTAGNYAVVLGDSNSSTATNGSVMGKFCAVDALHANVSGFNASSKGIINMRAFGSGTFNSIREGSIQAGQYVLNRATSAAGATTLTTNGAAPAVTNQIALKNNEVKAFHGTVVAKDSANTGVIAAWEITGLISIGTTAASAVLLGSTVTQIAATTSATNNGYAVSLSANTTLGCLQVNFSTTVANAVKVVSNIQTSECF